MESCRAMIEVVVTPTNDSAECETTDAARLAAYTLMREAREQGAGDPRATFLVDDVLVRANVKRSEV